jgi:hypothetical protein
MLSKLVVWLSIWDHINKIGALGNAWSFVSILLAPIVTGIGWYYYDKLQNEWFFYFFSSSLLVVIVLLIITYFYIKKRKSYDELYNENKKLKSDIASIDSFFTCTYFPLSNDIYEIVVNIDIGVIKTIADDNYELKPNKFTIISNEYVECIDNLEPSSDLQNQPPFEYRPITISDKYFKFKIKINSTSNFYIKINYSDPLISCENPACSIESYRIIYPNG